MRRPDAFAPVRAKSPKQDRSRLTLHRLLSAAEALLEHGGLEAATVPAIAEAAGVSVGVVYRRFPDKDALLRAVYERYYKTLGEQNAANLTSVATLNLPLPTLARALVLGMFEGYRRKPGLLRSLIRYARSHPDADFRRAAQQMNRATIKTLVIVLSAYEDKIKHPQPRMAIEFAVIAVASVLHTLILEEEKMHGLKTPANLGEELVRLFFGYLGIDDETASSRE